MELRKVQLTGGSSITVTLPKNWIEKAKIRPGDVVGCAEQPDGSLAIHAHLKGDRAIQLYTLEIDDPERESLFRKIVAAYLTGYDAIKVNSRRPMDAETRRAVRDAVRRIVGLEVVDESPTSLTIQDFLDPREFHMERVLRRMGMLTQAMQEEAMQSLRSPAKEKLQSAEDSDDEVDRLYWLVNKQYHAILRDSSYAAKMELNANHALNFLLAARLIERTADHADRIIRESLLLPPGKLPESIIGQMEKQGRKAAELFQNALQTFSRKDAKKANQIIDEANKFPETQKKLMRDATDLGSEVVAHLVFIIESIGRTAAYAADVCEVAINHKVASEAQLVPAK